MRLLVGTYSFPIAGMEANGEGIYSVSFDGKTGAFGAPTLLAECTNPSALVLSQNGSMLFAAREVFADDVPALVSFAVAGNGMLVPKQSLLIAGELPCHLAFDPVHSRLASAQYWTGDVAICTVHAERMLPLDSLTRRGSGPNTERQASPHAHCVHFSDGGTVLHLADLGTDSIVSHRLDGDGNAVETATVTAPPGAGPRHIVLNQAASAAWVVCELSESLIMLARNGLGWMISRTQQVFDTAAGEDGAAAAIRLSPDEAHVCISGRRQSQIAVLTADGTPVGTFDCGGTSPRDFIITPDGRWVIVANQLSNHLSSLRRDPQTGVLTLVENSGSIGSPVALTLCHGQNRQ